MAELTEEHELLRESVRAAGRGQDRPAGRRDRRDGEFPADVLRRARRRRTSTRCTSRRSTAARAPTRCRGCIVIEEVARACASSSLIPAVNKLGTTGILLAGSARRSAAALPARGGQRRGDVLVRAVRARGRQRRRGDAHARGPRRRRLGARRGEALDHQRRRLDATTPSWRSPTRTPAAAGSPRSSCTPTTRASPSARPSASSASRARRRASCTSTTCGSPADRIDRRPRHRLLSTALRTLDHTRPTIAAQAVGIAQGALDFAIGYVKERKQFGRAIAEFQGLQFMLADMQIAAARRPRR